MRKAASNSIITAVRMFIFTALLVAPVGAFAFASANTSGEGMKGAGLVLYVSLARNAG